MSIRLITDSSADIPVDILERYNIKQLPLHIMFGEEHYLDKVNLSPREFFEKLTENKTSPTTSQITPIEFLKTFNNELKDYDQVICMTMGANASGTFQSAMIARNDLEDESRVAVIDSGLFCNGSALLAIEIAKMIESDMAFEDIVEKANLLKHRIEVIFCVDTLKYLRKGGRIKSSEAIIGEVLQIKPMLRVEDGITKPVGKVRGRHKVYKFFLDYMEETLDKEALDSIILAHGQDIAHIEELSGQIKERFEIKNDFILAEVGATIGTHSGPGILAAAYIKK